MGAFIFFVVIAFISFQLFIAYIKSPQSHKSKSKSHTTKNTPINTSYAPTFKKTYERPHVDNSKFITDYTVIDVETTGLNYRTDKIIQFAAIRVRNRQIVDSLCVLINPGIPIPEEASKINGIKDDDVKDKPTFSFYSKEILDFLGNDYLVAHNIHFDRLFIEYQIGEALTNNNVDTLELAQSFYQLRDGYKLSNLYQYFTGEIADNAHDALYDCKMVHTIFESMKDDLGEKGIKLNPMAYDLDRTWYAYELPKREFKKPESDCKHLPFYKQHIVFTGKIPGLTRREAIQVVFDNGGDYGNQIRQKTTILVVGEYPDNNFIETAKKGLIPDQEIKIITADEFKSLTA